MRQKCVRACVSLASDSSETIKVIIIKLGTMPASPGHDNATRVHYIDLDLYSRSKILIVHENNVPFHKLKQRERTFLQNKTDCGSSACTLGSLPLPACSSVKFCFT